MQVKDAYVQLSRLFEVKGSKDESKVCEEVRETLGACDIKQLALYRDVRGKRGLIHTACAHANLDIVAALTHAHPDAIMSVDVSGRNVLHYAAMSRDVSFFKAVYRLALSYESMKAISGALDADDANKAMHSGLFDKDDAGHTPRDYAALFNSTAIAQYIDDESMQLRVSARSTEMYKTMLEQALKFDSFESLQAALTDITERFKDERI